MSRGRGISPNRRTVLERTGAALAAVSLAGCLGGRRSDGGDGATETVKVGPSGDLSFDPERVVVAPGTTVQWVWESDTHNVAVRDRPDGADWQGTGGDGDVYDEGYEHSHTFEVAGEYEYVCVPHESAGMTGTVVVEEP